MIRAGGLAPAGPRPPAAPVPPHLAGSASPGQLALVLVRVAQRRDLVLEVGQRLEPPVDRGEAQVGDLIEVTQRSEDGQPHLMRGNLRAAAGPDHVLDALGQVRELVLGHRPALTGPAHAPHDLVAGERLGDPAPLADHEDHGFLGGEPPAALRARPATADRRAVIRGPAVDDPAVVVPAERAAHAIAPSRPSPRVLRREHNLWKYYTGVATRCCGPAKPPTRRPARPNRG